MYDHRARSIFKLYIKVIVNGLLGCSINIYREIVANKVNSNWTCECVILEYDTWTVCDSRLICIQPTKENKSLDSITSLWKLDLTTVANTGNCRRRTSIRTSSEYGRKLLPISDTVSVAMQSVRECRILDPSFLINHF